jgi:hypothetical protein
MTEHELGPGVQLLCKWRDGKPRDAEIVEKRPREEGGFEYYVHYIGCALRIFPLSLRFALLSRFACQGTSGWTSGCLR